MKVEHARKTSKKDFILVTKNFWSARNIRRESPNKRVSCIVRHFHKDTLITATSSFTKTSWYRFSLCSKTADRRLWSFNRVKPSYGCLCCHRANSFVPFMWRKAWVFTVCLWNDRVCQSYIFIFKWNRTSRQVTGQPESGRDRGSYVSYLLKT